MKFFITDNDGEIRFDVSNAVSKETVEAIAEQGRISVEEVCNIVTKMRTIEENLAVLKDTAVIDAELTIVELEGKPVNETWKNEAQELDKCGIIELGLDWAVDEFYLKYDNNEFLPNSCNSVEVVTEEVAISNDNDLIDGIPEYTEDEVLTYKVGQTLSQYTKLGKMYDFINNNDTNAYFRFL